MRLVQRPRGVQLMVQMVVVVVVVVMVTVWRLQPTITHYLTPLSSSEVPERTNEERVKNVKQEGAVVDGKSNGLDAGDPPPLKRILAWTTFWKKRDSLWERIFSRLVSGQCQESNCELVYDHQLLESADAVLFHPNDIAPSKPFPETHPPGQPWIFFSLESPINVARQVKLNRLGGVFNWTMTYRRDSDVVVPYGLVLPHTVTPGPAKDYWSGKTQEKYAVWMVSHCKTESKREEFAKELAKHIPVDIFGKCGPKKCGKSVFIDTVGKFNQTRCTAEIETYKFYLAFENSICQDYVTEKLYQALTLEVVPVVFGGRGYEDLAPPHSYIDALAFPSPKHLAEYLKSAAANREEYNRYFEWKQHYRVELGHPFSPFVCDLCAKLHDPASLALPNVNRSLSEGAGVVGVAPGRDGSGSYPDLEGWFFRAANCRYWTQNALRQQDARQKKRKKDKEKRQSKSLEN